MAATGTDHGVEPANFIHLRVHSAYSLLEGAIHIKKLPDLCAKYGMPALALTDTGNLFGALEFSETMAKAGIQPIIGCALALRTDDDSGAAALGANAAKTEPRYLVLLAQSERGYVNLMGLTSMAFLEAPAGDVPHVKLSALSGLTDDLIALTGGAEGPVGALVQAGQLPAARALADQLAGLFPNRLYIELQRHGLAGEIAAEPGLIDLAYDLSLPLVATNDVMFADAGMF